MALVQAPVKSIDFVPLVYGSIAFSLGKTDDGTTHRWTIYVRGVNGKDLSGVISKVVFKLHPTCTTPIVECIQHPFETTQPGWGEFPAIIEVSFRDEKIPTVSFTHHLRLHHVNPSPIPTARPVVHETYDEVVFRNPSPEFTEKLQTLQSAACPPHNLSAYWKVFSEEADLAAIHKAHAFIKSQLETVVNDYGKVEAELLKVNAKISAQEAANKNALGASVPTNQVVETVLDESAVADATQETTSVPAGPQNGDEHPDAKRQKLE